MKIKNRQEWSIEILTFANENSMSLIDSLIHICNENDIAFEDTKDMIDGKLKILIQKEAEEMNLLKGTTKIDALEF